MDFLKTVICNVNNIVFKFFRFVSFALYKVIKSLFIEINEEYFHKEDEKCRTIMILIHLRVLLIC